MYQKVIENGYIISISKGTSNGNISEDEYNQILEVMHKKPTAPDGYDYRLREDLTWEMYEIPAILVQESEEGN